MRYNTTIVKAFFGSEGLPQCRDEFTFHPTRKWRFDFAWPDWKVALEVQGGAFSGGRHTRGAGMRSDIEKNNAAIMLGWRVLYVLPENLCMVETAKMIKVVLELAGLKLS